MEFIAVLLVAIGLFTMVTGAAFSSNPLPPIFIGALIIAIGAGMGMYSQSQRQDRERAACEASGGTYIIGYNQQTTCVPGVVESN